MQIDLHGKVAIVTGAGQGIGRVIALTLAEEGVVVIGVDIDETLAKGLQAEFQSRKLEGQGLRCDVRVRNDVRQMTSTVAERYGRLDILMNNAGVAPSGFVESFDERAWDDNLDVNLKGVFLCSQAVIPIMKRQCSGRIINASSFAAIVPSAGFSAYAASKAGVVSLTRVLAAELGPYNITVNSYAPGMIPTQLNHFAEAPPETQERLLNTLALRRWGQASDIANLVVFLSSELSGYITGAHIDISGGKFSVQMPHVAYERATKELLDSVKAP
jgi:3-oxoacyl-[acyl-carrier protein] reductase